MEECWLMGDPASRLLRLLSLLQAQTRWSGPALADRLGVTERTVRRDVSRLRNLGYPVDSASGVVGGYQLGLGGRLPPLLLDDDEAVAVAVSLGASTSGAVEGIERSALAALAKIDRLLPAHLRGQVRALGKATLNLAPEADPVSSEILVAIAHAVDGHERLLVDYRDRDGTSSQRRLDPYRLATTGRRWYLAARDAERDAWRTLRVDRIRRAKRTGHLFEPMPSPDGVDVDTILSEAITTSPYRFQAKVIVGLTPSKLRARVPPTVGVVTAHPNDKARSVLTVGSNSVDALAGHLVQLGAPFEVIEPAELRDRIDRLTDDLIDVRHRSRGRRNVHRPE